MSATPTPDALRGALSDSVEEAPWAAMRSLEEKASLLRRMGARSGDKRAAEYQQETGQFDRHVETIRQILIHHEGIEAREKRASA